MFTKCQELLLIYCCMGSTSFPINWGSVSTMSATQGSAVYAKDNKAYIYARITVTPILLAS